MSPNATMASHASHPEGCFLPRAAAKATSSAPAGSRRSAATKNGPVRGMTPFMATMAVPQKKKGDIRDAHSQSSFPETAVGEARTAASLSTSASTFDAAGERAGRRGAAPPASTKHSTSEAVPTQSSESAGAGAGAGAGGEGGEDSRRARTAAARRIVAGAGVRRLLRVEERGRKRGGGRSGRRRRPADAGRAAAGIVAAAVGGGLGRGTVGTGRGVGWWSRRGDVATWDLFVGFTRARDAAALLAWRHSHGRSHHVSIVNFLT